VNIEEINKHKYWPFKSFYKINLKISEKETEQIKILLHNFKHSIDKHQTTTYQQLDILSLPLLKDLKDQIIKILEPLNLVVGNNWAQLYRKGDHHAPHAHYLSEYSGIIYIDGDTPEGTNFISPVGAGCYTTKFNKNDLILFPSHILHFVDVQKDNTNRIVISFNTQPKQGGIYG
jgi:cupin superfamily acireductone dioxygenase involved in methionine salvage